MRSGELAAAALLLAGSASFGVMMGEIMRSGGLGIDTYSEADLGKEPAREWVTVVLLFGLTGLSLDAFGRWAAYYAETGEFLSTEELEASYE